MYVNIQLPDEVYQRYAERRPDRPQAALVDTLKEFVDKVPGVNRLVIEGEQLRELVRLFQVPIEGPEHLLKLIERDRRVGFGDGIDIHLTEAQRTRLKAQSDFMIHPTADKDVAFREYVSREVGRALSNVTGL